MGDYRDDRFGREGRIWGMKPGHTAEYACDIFRRHGIRDVLVPGAGYGRNASLFARSGFAVTGIEISPAAVALAGAGGDGVKYMQGSFLDVLIEPGSFDAIYCFNVLHLFNEADRRLFSGKCADAMREGGLAFFAAFLESGIMEDPEDPGDEGPHVHTERYILASGRKH